jgi:hypothetical protein
VVRWGPGLLLVGFGLVILQKGMLVAGLGLATEAGAR